jgi:hypothetical protein
MANDPPEEVQRWTVKRPVALVVSILKGETPVQQAARKHGLTVAEAEDWRERFLLAADNRLRARPKDEEALTDEHIKNLKQKIGELVLGLDILKEAAKHRAFLGEPSETGKRPTLGSRNAGSAGWSDLTGRASAGCPGRRRDDPDAWRWSC